MENILAKHLIDTGGHCGYKNPELKRLADKSGVSVHTLQSIAIGRRVPRERTAKAIKKAIGHKRYAELSNEK